MHYLQLSITALESILDFAVDLPPSSFCHRHLSGDRKDLYSHLRLKRMEKKSHKNWVSRSHLVNDRAGPKHGLPNSGLPLWQSLSSSLLGPSPPHQMLLLSSCVSAGGWQCCWLLSGSVWAFLFHPLIKSCTFLIGEQNLQKRKKNPPFQNIQGLKFIWLWNAHQGLNALLRGKRWKPVTH